MEMCLKTAPVRNWASGGTVDTSVLGTDFFGSGGSNPLSPTISNSSLNCYPSSKLHGNGSCTRCCTCCISSRNIKRKGADYKDYSESVGLRNVCTHLIYSLLHIIQQ